MSLQKFCYCLAISYGKLSSKGEVERCKSASVVRCIHSLTLVWEDEEVGFTGGVPEFWDFAPFSTSNWRNYMSNAKTFSRCKNSMDLLCDHAEFGGPRPRPLPV